MSRKVVERLVKTRRTFESVVQHIREQVASGAVQPGDRLPPERTLAEQLQVGRNAVREAMRNLENAGVVVLERGAKGGAFIQNVDAQKITQAVRDMVDLGSISVEDITELRIHLFDPVVRLACQRATESDFRAMELLNERLATTVGDDDPVRRMQHSLEFYHLLAASTKNNAFQMVVDSINNAVLQLVGATDYPVHLLAEARRSFIEHFRRRDAIAASAALNALLVSVKERARRGRLDQSG
jgi:GntR family transcriptional repressor for pyruvate dehydrogenase complex